MQTDMKFTLNIEYDDTGLWFITSPDARGLLMSDTSIEKALAELPDALADLAMAYESPGATQSTLAIPTRTLLSKFFDLSGKRKERLEAGTIFDVVPID